MMRAIGVTKNAGSSAVKLLLSDKVAMPVPKEDELLVKVKYFAVNRLDILQKNGKYPVPEGASEILGVEFSGVVVQEAAAADSVWKKGDRVFGLVSGGAYAEYATMNSKMAMRIPESMSFMEAAALPEVWFTAFQAISLIGNLKAKESVLIHAAASGVGTAAIQIAKHLEAKNIIVTAGSTEKLSFCQSLGATTAINYKTEPSFSDTVLKETDGKGVDVIMDFVGAAYWKDNLKSLGLDGRLILQGLMSGAKVPGDEPFDLSIFLRKRISIHGSTLRARSLAYQINLRNEFASKILPFFGNGGHFKPIIHGEFNWTNIEKAHEVMESNSNIGKIVVSTE